jgi:hypothetical protein
MLGSGGVDEGAWNKGPWSKEDFPGEESRSKRNLLFSGAGKIESPVFMKTKNTALMEIRTTAKKRNLRLRFHMVNPKDSQRKRLLVTIY